MHLLVEQSPLLNTMTPENGFQRWASCLSFTIQMDLKKPLGAFVTTFDVGPGMTAPMAHRKTCHQCHFPTAFDLPSSSVQSQSTKVCSRDMTSLCQPRALPEGCTFLPLIRTAGVTVAQDDSAEVVSRPGFYRSPAVACTTELCTSQLGANK